jgi:hypothetical protein
MATLVPRRRTDLADCFNVRARSVRVSHLSACPARSATGQRGGLRRDDLLAETRVVDDTTPTGLGDWGRLVEVA